MPRIAETIILTEKEQAIINGWAKSKTLPVRIVQRARIIQMAANHYENIEKAPEIPSLNFPTAPSLDAIQIPDNPNITLPNPIEMPGRPAYMLFRSDLRAPTINFDQFLLDNPPELLISGAFRQPDFSGIPALEPSKDSLITEVHEKLIDNLRHATGLDAKVEADIWKRDLERNEQQLQDSTDKIATAWAKKGFSLPDGMLAHSIAELQKEYMNRIIDRSREIAIKQEELAHGTMLKSLEIGASFGINLQELLIKHADLIMRIESETMKFMNEYIRLQIETNNNMIEYYKADVLAFKTRIEAEVSKIEAFKAEVDVESAKAIANEGMAGAFSAEVNAKVAVLSAESETNKALASIVSSQAQVAQVQAAVQEVKLRAFSEQIKAVAAQMEAYESQQRVYAERAKISVEQTRTNVAIADAYAHKISALASVFQAQIEQSKAIASDTLARGQLSLAASQAQANLTATHESIAAHIAELQEKSNQFALSARLEAAKAVASASASLAAGAMSGLHGQGSLSSTVSDSTSVDTNYNYRFD